MTGVRFVWRLVPMFNLSAPITRARTTMAAAAAAHAPSTNLRRARCPASTAGSDSGTSGRNCFKYASKRSSSRVGTGILLRGPPNKHRVAQLGQRIAVSRCHRVRAEVQQVTDLREGQFAPDVQNHDLPLIVRKRLQRASQVLFSRIIPVWRTKPGRVRIKRRIALPQLAFVQSSASYAREQISLLVHHLSKTPFLDQLQEHLVDRILSPAPLPRNRLGEEQQRRPVLAIQELDLGCISVSSAHVAVSAVSIVRQSSTPNLSTRLFGGGTKKRQQEDIKTGLAR